ncbi:uncharacterized protein Dvir_GJ16928, isoform C [Drosophila virilis]|uniref:Uncharacterized protein, isoform C n=2 Tax=Drosophila virilis TaxID=7244 RepID=A0A0Q9WJL7_DROVI|nr:uncharacterized protein LOC6633264 isoform X1 [Drosophila virilis]KRF80741.1 uncharacterized protein Dvir_GJ16928, isoform C [Drosophila virilis]
MEHSLSYTYSLSSINCALLCGIQFAPQLLQCILAYCVWLADGGNNVGIAAASNTKCRRRKMGALLAGFGVGVNRSQHALAQAKQQQAQATLRNVRKRDSHTHAMLVVVVCCQPMGGSVQNLSAKTFNNV